MCRVCLSGLRVPGFVRRSARILRPGHIAGRANNIILDATLVRSAPRLRTTRLLKRHRKDLLPPRLMRKKPFSPQYGFQEFATCSTGSLTTTSELLHMFVADAFSHAQTSPNRSWCSLCSCGHKAVPAAGFCKNRLEHDFTLIHKPFFSKPLTPKPPSP